VRAAGWPNLEKAKGNMSLQTKHLLGGVALLTASGLLLFACTSSTSNVSATQACADVAQARCQKMQECDPQGLANTYGELSACQTTQATTCLGNLAAPDTANTPEHTEACAQAVPGESCDDNQLGNVPTACLPPAGPRDAGSDCAVSGQCATAYCLVSKTTSCGVCAASPGLGDSCSNNSCGAGLLCDKVSLLCVAPVEASGACNDSSACAPALTCLGNTGSALGTCVPLAMLGASCDLADGGSRCDARFGLYCNTEAGKVCATVATAAASQSCGTVDGGVIDCLADAFCQKPTDSAAGTCVAPAAEGATCDTATGPICATPARCVLDVSEGTTGVCHTTNPALCN
jgi:hypothetical protein